MHLAVHELNQMKHMPPIEIICITGQKIILRFNSEMLMTCIIRFSTGDTIKMLLSPSIGSLNDFMAAKFLRVLRNHSGDLDLMKKLYKIYLNEFAHSWDYFREVHDLQYSCDSMLHGPNMDNISMVFEFQQTQFESANVLEELSNTSLAIQSQAIKDRQILQRELIMIVNYRRIF